MNPRDIVDSFLNKKVEGKAERKAILKLAEIEEEGASTPRQDLPNIKKDRLVLELTNRTNTPSTINLFGLPSGTNSSQNLEYGDLFETTYSFVEIPIADVTSAKYKFQYSDQNGATITGETVVVDNIDDLVSELMLVTGGNWSYYIVGANYFIHKQPINTWLYWNPPSSLVFTASTGSGLKQNTAIPPSSVASIVSIVQSPSEYIYSLFGGFLTYWVQTNQAQLGQIDFDTLYSFGGIGTRSFMINLDSLNQFVCMNYDTSVLLRNSIDGSGNPINQLNITLAQSSAGMTWDGDNSLLWSSGGATGGVNNDLYIYSQNGILLDTWAVGSAIPLSANTLSIGYSRIIINESGVAEGVWLWRGNDGSNALFKALVKIGGYDVSTGNIVQSIEETIGFVTPIFDQLGMTVLSGDEPTIYCRIGVSNKFFIVISNNATPNNNYIGVVDCDTEKQTWKHYANNDLTVIGDAYYNELTDCIVAKVNYLGNVTVRAINYDTLEMFSGTLLDTVYNGAFFCSSFESTIYVADTGVDLGYVEARIEGGLEVAPANSQPAAFYNQNSFNFIQNRTTFAAYFFINHTVIGGTGISVTELIGNLTYAEIVQEIRSGIEPYYFDKLSVYADTDEQANTPIKKVSRGIAGNAKTLLNNPTIVNQNKHIVLNTPINFLPKTINQLDYKVAPFSKVRIIINYTKGNLNAIVDTLNEYIEEGIPFSVGLNQLADSVSIKKEDEKYLEKTLKDIWNRKKAELKAEGVDIEIDNLFEPQSAIDSKKAKLLGEKTKIIQGLLEEQKLENSGLRGLSKNNIKRIVSNYAAKGKADDMHDPYNYVDGR